MQTFISIVYQILDNYAFLIISAIGLAIIYGMMGVINLAHGEFIMMGAYVTTLLTGAGCPLVLSIICGTIFVALFGGLMDFLFISRLYNRPLDSIVATWGLSLILSTSALVLLGTSLPNIPTPFGPVTVLNSSYSIYRLLLIAIAIILPILLYLIFSKTRFGLKSRATMQSPLNAGYLGVNTRRMYSLTFMIGSAFAGLAGGLYAPTMTIAPTMGQSFQMQSFVTVVTGGVEVLPGLVSSSMVLGTELGAVSVFFDSYFARLGMLVLAILILRVLPSGTSALVDKWRERQESRRRKEA